MNQKEKNLIQALRDLGDATIYQIAARTGMTPRQADVILSYIHCVYISGWTDGKAIWRLADTPPNCPKP